jgi:nicotinamide-nucleotide amidase
MDDPFLERLSVQVGEALKARGLMIATAESCTGGWIAQVLTAIAGSSTYVDRGFVTYSNEAKQDMLGVPAATIASHGAVSEATVQAMAAGALAHSRAQVAVSVSGVAGPGGGTPVNPVGTVCFGWALRPAGTAGAAAQVLSARVVFQGDRESVRRQSVQYSLQGVLRLLESVPA